MRTINKQHYHSEKQERSTILRKEVDPDYLGREIYADNVETPYSFYLVRKLTLAKDYQNLAEGEAFFDAICDSWDGTEAFEELIVKKIYMYVETEIMYYTLLMGSFEPTKRDLRINLKKWLEEVSLEKQTHSLVHNGEASMSSGEMQGMMKQMLETSNEIFRLRKMIGDLTETINNGQIEIYQAKSNPVISRSIKTIHLKRAQPLIEEDSKKEARIDVPFVKPAIQLDEESQQETAEEVVGKTVEKKLQTELAENPIQENFQTAEKISILPKLKTENNVAASQTDPKTPESKAAQLNIQRLKLNKNQVEKLSPKDWTIFSVQLKASKMIEGPQRLLLISKKEQQDLEEAIYRCFVTKRMRKGNKKSHTQKQSILRSELLAQIEQAEYLTYSWGQVLRIRKEDLLICNRLSCSSLVRSVDDFLEEMRAIAYSRSLFGKKVKCSVELLRRLDGYILMDQYMQKLIAKSDESE